MNQPLRHAAPGGLPGEGPQTRRPNLRALRGGWSNAPTAPSFAPLGVPVSNFESRKLERVSANRVEIRASVHDRLLCAATALTGFLLLASTLTGFQDTRAGLVLTLGSGFLAVIAALAIWRIGGTVRLDADRREFTRHGGLFHAGSTVSVKVAFDDVIAVQLLESELVDEEASWTIYQVNLVRRDGSRVHVAPHVDAAQARDTAATVADMIGVEVIEAPVAA